MYGHRAAIGVIIPSINNVIEPEFNAVMPEGIAVYATRLPLYTSAKMLGSSNIEGLMHMAKGVQEAARLLVDAKVDIIAYVCTTGSLVRGVGWDQELINQIEEATGILATTTSTAMIRAFKELGVGKVAIASPYIEELNQIERQFLEAHCIKVVNTKSLGKNLQDAIPEDTYRLACEVNTPEADAVFITCAGFKSITVIEKLEEKLQKYVFSSNTATIWDILKRLKIIDQIRGCGKLFQH